MDSAAPGRGINEPTPTWPDRDDAAVSNDDDQYSDGELATPARAIEGRERCGWVRIHRAAAVAVVRAFYWHRARGSALDIRAEEEHGVVSRPDEHCLETTSVDLRGSDGPRVHHGEEKVMARRDEFVQTRVRRRVPTLGLGMILSLAVLLALPATARAQTAATNGGSANAITETNVTNDPTRDNGQPEVAVNPKDRNNLVFISTDHRPGERTVTPDKFHCYAAYSRDGGAKWTEIPWPNGNRAMCGDPNLVVDSHGVFYVAFNRLGCAPGEPEPASPGSCTDVPNHLGFSKSLDGGRTWSAPIDTPLLIGVTPRLRIDAANDNIYAVGQDTAGNIAVSVTKNRGATWSDPAVLPQQPFGTQIAAQGGTLAAATGVTVNLDNGVVFLGTDVIFQASRDGGKTFTNFPVTTTNGTPVAPPVGPSLPNLATGATDPLPWVSADPTHNGRFALMIPRSDNLEVYITENSGAKWTGPTVIPAAGAVKPWIDFGSTGLLGVMWRTSAVDVYSAVSFNRGKTFSPPVKVNKVTEPGVTAAGDEFSRILVTDKYAYVSWSDGRNGGTPDGVLARVPISRYK
ncbi:sialidase family protein [Pseudofrankia saprophytica]|uniref:sialidase family protein n=1 Tax=Pseudofrankia saprophytica TaxID=298655 RepID=UPI0010422467|nr:sialidase family protein [Pseudofrankia saprophytica]